MRHLRPGQPHVERHEDPAHGPDREHRLHERGMVLAKVRDPVATLDAEPAQRRGQPGDPVMQHGVGEPGVLMDQGERAWRLASPARGPGT